MSYTENLKRNNRINRQASLIPINPPKDSPQSTTNPPTTHANITHTNITHANITHTNITHANTTHANTTHAPLQLHRVLGITNPSVAAIGCSPDGVLAYPAGCVVVLYDLKKDTQSYLMNAARKAIVSLNWSADGRYIVTGEQGHKPCVRIWEHSSLRELACLAGHTHGIDFVYFHPDHNYVISVGAEHDKSVFVWYWRSQSKIGANNKTFKVNCMSVSEDGSFFVLVGLRTVRFCQYDAELSHRSRRVSTLVSRNALLGAHQSLNYVAVTCNRAKCTTNNDTQTKTYVLSQRGIMLIINSEREVITWIDTQIRQARCISITDKFIFCGGINATIRIFEIPSLQYLTSMPIAMSSEEGDTDNLFPDENRYHPTAVSITINVLQSKLFASYSNHSIYLWNIHNLLQQETNKGNSTELIQDQPSRTFLFHSSHIWSAEIYPSGLQYPCLPDCFVTGSSDGTVRIWWFSTEKNDASSTSDVNGFKCPELIHILCPQDPQKEVQNENTTGIKSLCISPDGLYLGAGEKRGWIRIYDLRSMKLTYNLQAHSGEILQMDFSPDIPNLPPLLASSGKDRSVKVFKVDDNFAHFQTLLTHSGAVTCVKFHARNSSTLYLISCGTDRSIKYFQYNISNGSFEMKHHIINSTNIYGMDIDCGKQRLAVSGQDKHVRFYSLEDLSTRSIGKISGTVEEKGLLQVAFDPSGRYMITSSAQKNVLLFDMHTKGFLSHVYGHSEMITSVKFNQNGYYFVSVGADGCAFVWRLPTEVTQNIHKLIDYEKPCAIEEKITTANEPIPTSDILLPPSEENPIPPSEEDPIPPSEEDPIPPSEEDPIPPSPVPFTPEPNISNTDFSTVSKLPPWILRHINPTTQVQLLKRSVTPDAKSTGGEWGLLPMPTGKWAQRAESMVNLSVPENLLNTAMIDTSFVSTQSTVSSCPVTGDRTVGDGEDSPVTDTQPFTPFKPHSKDAPKFESFPAMVNSSLKHRSTSLSHLLDQRKEDIAFANRFTLEKPSPIEETSDLEISDIFLDNTNDSLHNASTDIPTLKDMLSVSQPISTSPADISIIAPIALSQSTLCNSGSDSDHTPIASPSLRPKRSNSAKIERATSMQIIPSENKFEFKKPISHPLSNASSLYQLNTLSPSLSPAGENKFLHKLTESTPNRSLSTSNLTYVGSEQFQSRLFTRSLRGKKKLPNLPDSPIPNLSAKEGPKQQTTALDENVFNYLQIFLTRIDGLTPQLIAKAYPKYYSIVELAQKIPIKHYKHRDVGVNTDRHEHIDSVLTDLSKVSENVNEIINRVKEMK